MYSINVDTSNRIIALRSAPLLPEGAIEVSEIPEGNPLDYLYIDGNYQYDPLPEPEPPTPSPSPQEQTDALMLDHEERIIYLELGVNDNAVSGS